MSFTNKVVVITGAGSGIGAGIAKQFAKEGATVVAVDINPKGLKATAECCNHVLQIIADVTKDEDIERVIEETIDKYGKIDVLVNCAGILRPGLILDGTILQSFDDMININLRAVINLTSAAAPHLVKSKGNIINISSICDRQNSMPFVSYCAIKAAVSSFTKGTALELGPSGVRANAICPGTCLTSLSGFISNNLEHLEKITVLGKLVTPEEIADLAVYLASDKARSVTGTTFVIDNGYALKSAS